MSQLGAAQHVDIELVDAFDEQALAIASSCAAPNTGRAYTTAYRAFAAFLRNSYGTASRETFTLAAVAAWRDELAAQGLAPSSVAQRVSAVRRLASAIGARRTHPAGRRPSRRSATLRGCPATTAQPALGRRPTCRRVRTLAEAQDD